MRDRGPQELTPQMGRMGAGDPATPSGQPAHEETTSGEVEQLHAQIRACTRCGLHATRTHAVPGAGAPAAEIMIVGEAPGFNEDVQSLPFVGPAGKLLDTLLSHIG